MYSEISGAEHVRKTFVLVPADIVHNIKMCGRKLLLILT
jgi:hypothetical protein